MKIGWITDLHIGIDREGMGLHDLQLYLDYAMQQFDYVMITGDLVNFHPVESYHERFQETVALLHQYGERIRVIPGNHDYPALTQTPNGDRALTFQDSAWAHAFSGVYESPIITPICVFAFAALNIASDAELGINYKVEGDYTLSAADVALLQKITAAMQGHVGKELYLMTHIPLFPNITVGVRKAYQNPTIALEVLRQYHSVTQVCSGHWHFFGQMGLPTWAYAQTVLSAFYQKKECSDGMINRPNYEFDCSGEMVAGRFNPGYPAPR